MSLNNEQCKTRPAIINSNSTELKYYPFVSTLDKCNGSCNALRDLTDRIYVNVNLNIFNLITRTNGSKNQ